jgi:hypothetical protein
LTTTIGYLNAAESFCNAGHKNMVETCIMSESCNNICKCIKAAEKASIGEASIAIVDQQGSAVIQTDFFNNPKAVGFTETGIHAHEKRFAFIFWAIIGLIFTLEMTAVSKFAIYLQ